MGKRRQPKPNTDENMHDGGKDLQMDGEQERVMFTKKQDGIMFTGKQDGITGRTSLDTSPGYEGPPAAKTTLKPKTLVSYVDVFVTDLFVWALATAYYFAGAFQGVILGVITEVLRGSACLAAFSWIAVSDILHKFPDSPPEWVLNLRTVNLLPRQAAEVGKAVSLANHKGD